MSVYALEIRLLGEQVCLPFNVTGRVLKYSWGYHDIAK
jgi:hypothetical protein